MLPHGDEFLIGCFQRMIQNGVPFILACVEIRFMLLVVFVSVVKYTDISY